MIPQVIETTPDRPYCWDENDGYLCTRERDHRGLCAAGYRDDDGRLAIAHTWRQATRRVDVDELAANLDVAADDYRTTMADVAFAATDGELVDWLESLRVAHGDHAPVGLAVLLRAANDHRDAVRRWEWASNALDRADGAL